MCPTWLSDRQGQQGQAAAPGGDPQMPPLPCLGKQLCWGGDPVGRLASAPLLPSSLAVPCDYPPDSLGWKLFYITGCLFVAVQNLEDWEVRSVRVSARVRCSETQQEGRSRPGVPS